ncbi:MAG: RimK family alpha-L-glutamate ligase [Clostridiales bacterium]|jgi:RimK family alpha-L-glutamate ligase|nr:RimK family alpha-L-glutamate ligase [Clostridiales bacterium]
MQGLLVTNEFFRTEKFDGIYDMLCAAFKKGGLPLTRATNAETALEISRSGRLKDINFILFWDKDVLLAKRLENLGYKVINSSRVIEICDSKALTAAVFENSGIKTPKTFIAPFTYDNVGYTSYGFLERAADILGFPMVVKENFGSFGEQVYLIADMNGLKSLCKRLSPRGFIMQEYVASAAGTDVRIHVVGDRAVAAVKRTAKNGGFISNVTNGGQMSAFSPPKEFLDLAIRVCSYIGADFAGVDLLFGKDGEPILCEINSNAHFKNLRDATGINVASSIAEYVKTVIV